MKVTDHVTYQEATKSFTATRLGIENIPDSYQESNMYAVAQNVFEPLREWVGGPIKINSFFRSPYLNKAIGGSSKSQHCEGRAIDVDDVYGHATNAEMFNYIKDNLSFDQLIWEFGDENNPDWVHFSYISEDGNRKNVFKAVRENGKVNYQKV